MNPTKSPKSIITKRPLLGGQEYAATMKGGVVLVDNQIIYSNLFAVSTSSGGTYDKMLTNLDQPGRLNDGEGYEAFQFGIRMSKIDAATPATAAEISDVLRFLGACRLQLFVGPNSQRVLDLETIHFMNTVSAITKDAPAVAGDGVGSVGSFPINSVAWVALPGGLSQTFKENMAFKASLECELPEGTPVTIGGEWIFNFLMSGRRIVNG